jgi:hypothetical protein
MTDGRTKPVSVRGFPGSDDAGGVVGVDLVAAAVNEGELAHTCGFELEACAGRRRVLVADFEHDDVRDRGQKHDDGDEQRPTDHGRDGALATRPIHASEHQSEK